jgi:SAM-dependent methyltransferase
MPGDLLDRYYAALRKEGLHRSTRGPSFYQRTFFRGISFAGKRLLDIGGGNGEQSFYAACRGAAQVVCLEPDPREAEVFGRLAAALPLPQVTFCQSTIQEYEPGDGRFDLLLSHDSINHVDETACINLRRDPAARQAYLEVFRKLHRLAAPGATLLITDASPHNFFPHLHLRNPFSRGIEWHKHQPPRVWATLLAEAGFTRPHISWSSIGRFLWPGRLLLGNRVGAYFLNSHFRLVMQR